MTGETLLCPTFPAPGDHVVFVKRLPAIREDIDIGTTGQVEVADYTWDRYRVRLDVSGLLITVAAVFIERLPR